MRYWVPAQCVEDGLRAASARRGSPGTIPQARCPLTLSLPSQQPAGGSACSRARVRTLGGGGGGNGELQQLGCLSFPSSPCSALQVPGEGSVLPPTLCKGGNVLVPPSSPRLAGGVPVPCTLGGAHCPDHPPQPACGRGQILSPAAVGAQCRWLTHGVPPPHRGPLIPVGVTAPEPPPPHARHFDH